MTPARTIARLAAVLIAAPLIAAPLLGAGPTTSAQQKTQTNPPTATAAAPPTAPRPAAPIPAPPPPDPMATLRADQQVLAQVQAQIQTASTDPQLAALGARASQIEAAADRVIAGQTADLAGLASELKRYAPRARHRQTESERRASAPLLAQQTALQNQLRQSQAVAAAANRIFNLVAERRREGFSARVLQRSASPLSPDFWTSLADAAGGDFNRFVAFLRESARGITNAPEPWGLVFPALGLAFTAVLLMPGRRGLESLGRRRVHKGREAEKSADPPRLPRTAYAVWITVVDVGLPALAAVALHLSAQWAGLLSEKTDALFDAAIGAVIWGAAVVTLGRVLATDRDPSRRLLDLPEGASGRIRVSLWGVAGVTGAGFLLTRLNYVIGASVAATIASNCILSIAYSGVAGLILIRAGRSRSLRQTPETADSGRTPIWTLVSLGLTTAITVTLGALLLGYTTLAALISSQIFWLGVLAAVSYLLLRFADDLSDALFRPKGWAARLLHGLFSLRRTTVGQIGVLLSAGLQLLIIIGAVSLAVTPFGQSGDRLFTHVSQLGHVIHIGSATISPSAIAAGLVTLAFGMAFAHLVRGWIVQRYLPVTDWDSGLRNSVSTGVGYLGVGISLVCALAAMGLGFKQIALIASALSVGIGFGLQQIVQNFVSGVILLVERPVKVGDWVTVDGVEGDIRRIRVRATEIQTFDRSTIIVPNSDLITKAVQNKTLGDPRGRILLQVSIASPADAQKARSLILALAKAKSEILQDPAPAVYIDSLAGGGAVNFNCYLYVDSPRNAYKTRSALYFEILERFAQDNIGFIGASGPANIVVEPGPTMEALLSSGVRTAPVAANP